MKRSPPHALLTAHSVSLVRAVGHIEAGHARLAAGNIQAAAQGPTPPWRNYGRLPPEALIAPALQELQGNTCCAPAARPCARDARGFREEDPGITGPDNWVQALFTMESIGRTAREAGDWPFAEWIGARWLITINITRAATTRSVWSPNIAATFQRLEQR
jgi:hypothetical protein